jgi:hypothetical protein
MKQAFYTSKTGLKFFWPALLLAVLAATSPSFLPVVRTEYAFADADNDGYPTPQDCDDSNPAINPGAIDVCNSIDDNCNGQVDETCRIYYEDNDRDGYGRADRFIYYYTLPRIGYSSQAGDCDDNNSRANPGMPEICASPFDDNCDGVINEGCKPFYRDNDGDGWGHEFQRIFEMVAPPGYLPDNSDCNDFNPAVNPGMAEVCDSLDNNCNGQVDEGCQTYYRDVDEDGYGAPNVTINATSPPAGYVTNSSDCNDYDPAISPAGTETCNFKDDDCDGQVDEGCMVFYRDADADGYGLWHVQTRDMTQPPGYSSIGGDCDDADPAVRPGVIETCNFKDDDCDGQVDEGCQVFYRDADADGYGLWHVQTRAMTQPAGYSTIGGDCDDANANIYPGAAELCNGINDDCDGLTDEGCPGSSANNRGEQKEAMNTVDLRLTAYPNPANNIFTVRLEGDRKFGKVSLRIMNHLGEIKETRNSLDVGQTIKLGDGYPAGAYFIEATQGKNKKVIKVVKL